MVQFKDGSKPFLTIFDGEKMNANLQAHARKTILEGLSKLPDKNVQFFKRMYSSDDLERDINLVVAEMSEDSLSHAMDQIERTLKT